MPIKENSRIVKTLTVSNLNTRIDIRKFILNEWGKEAVGKKYRYFVEVLDNGKHIYLERPASLNKGCDFKILIEDLFLYKNGYDRPPSHTDLIDDLMDKKKLLDSQTWSHLIRSIEAVHQIISYEMPSDCKNKINNLGTMSVEQIQLLCKWLFIEQDITYWSGDGRDMLLKRIKSI
ncbi:hypothetical protein [Candidatus Spongiihabitans sp.]|uniref:hypothetical protein n=1 Tax=Candidatus Spongiihabitans sp. TaxID=3101308 RepID=UPI003C6F3994